MKRLICFILAVVTVLGLTGCANMLEEEYLSIEEHTYTEPEPERPGTVTEVSSYRQLLESVISMIRDYREKETVRFVEYKGNAENDLSDVCAEVMNVNPIGVYSAYYVGYTVNKFVSYSEAEISIIYKKTEEQVEGVLEAETRENVERLLESALEYNSEYIAIYTSDKNITKEDAVTYIKEMYYEHPEYAVILPDITASAYPEDGREKIIEVEMEYPYISSLMTAMQGRLSTKIENYLAEASDLNDYMRLDGICRIISENVSCEEDNMTEEKYDPTNSINTAYSAMMLLRASSEGIAMAVKMMCDASDIECIVVIGKLDGNVHAWNIVNYNGNYYHLDASNYQNGFFLESDEEIISQYWWDTSSYPKCVAKIDNGGPVWPSGTTTGTVTTEQSAGE